MSFFGTHLFHDTSCAHSGSCKRSRDERPFSTLGDRDRPAARRRRDQAEGATSEHVDIRETWSPNPFQTPIRRGSLEVSHPLDAPVPRCRSPSMATSDLDGLTSSDNSVHFLELGVVSHPVYSSGSNINCGGEDQGHMSPKLDFGPIPVPVLTDADAQQWQRDLTQFFARLDQRPLCVVPVERDRPTNEE